MKKSETQGLVELDSLMSRGGAYLLANAGKAITLITILVMVLVTFTDVSFIGIGSERFTTTLFMLLVSSYLIYFAMEDAGETLGEDTEEYKVACDRYEKARSAVPAGDVLPLRRFCIEYSNAELEYRRLSHLAEAGYSDEEYKDYLGGKKFPRRAAKVFRRAAAMRSCLLTPSLLLSGEYGKKGKELTPPTRSKAIAAVIKLLPSSICMLFTASLVLTAKSGLSASMIIEGVLKLSALPLVGIKGYAQGFSYARTSRAEWMRARASILEDFIEKKKEA